MVYDEIKSSRGCTKLDKEVFKRALIELSNALDAVAWLTQEETYGDEFHQEILIGELGHVWGESIDEMAYDVWVATDKIREN